MTEDYAPALPPSTEGSDDPLLLRTVQRMVVDRAAGRLAPLATYLGSVEGRDIELARWYLGVSGHATRCGAEPEVANVPPAVPDGEPRRIGRFEILSEIGRGGQGVVYRARDPLIGRDVAVKLLLAEGMRGRASRERLLREAKCLASTRSSGICPVHDVGEHDGVPYLVMAYIEGVDLARVLACRDPRRDADDPAAERYAADLDPATAAGRDRLLRIVQDTALAVHAMHDSGLLHRDLKPSNLMVTMDYGVVVLDFGLARRIDDGAASTIGVAGTPHYLSPERFDREEPTSASDLWALGVILFEAFLGRKPFEGETIKMIEEAAKRGFSVNAEERMRLGAELRLVVGGCLERYPADRYRSAKALAEDLRRLRENRPALVRTPTLPRRFRRTIQRNPVAAVVTALLTALVLLVVLLVFANRASEAKLVQQNRIATARRFAELETAVARLYGEADALGRPTPELEARREEWFSRLATLKTECSGIEDEIAVEVPHTDPRPELAAEAAWRQEIEEADAELAALRDQTRVMDGKLEDLRNGMRPDSHRNLTVEALNYVKREREERIRLVEDRSAKLRAVGARAEVLEDGFRKVGLIARLRGLADAQPFRPGVLRVERARDLVRKLPGETTTRFAVEWRRACATFAERFPAASPALQPLPGLVPLGPDPASGLLEFADMLTGQPVTRGADDRLVVPAEAGLVFVLVPGGRVRIGAQATDRNATNFDRRASLDASPPVDVELAPFLLSKFEMTQGQWLRIFPNCGFRNPSKLQSGDQFGTYVFKPVHPVENMARAEAVAVLADILCVLPSEAQWEHAMRAGRGGIYGEFELEAHIAGKAAIGMELRLPYPTDAHRPVGIYPPNRFGFHDMIGNVKEWCADAHDHYWVRSPARGTGLRFDLLARNGVVRGGSYASALEEGRAAFRREFDPADRSVEVGIRPVRLMIPESAWGIRGATGRR